MAEFAVVRAERIGGPVADHEGGATTRRGRTGVYKTARVFADFLVDGQRLSAIARQGADLISTLGWGPEPYQRSVVDHLLLRGDPS